MANTTPIFISPDQDKASQSAFLNENFRRLNDELSINNFDAGAILLGNDVPTDVGSATAANSHGVLVDDTGIYAMADGQTATSANVRLLTDGTAYFAGTVTAGAGDIGGWNIGATSLTDDAGAVGMSSAVTAGDDIRFWAGHATPTSAPFKVTEAGELTATDATITGDITASSGAIGGFTIGATDLSVTTTGNTTILSSGNIAFSAGPTGSPSVTISKAGVLTATGASISGTLSVDSIDIGGADTSSMHVDTSGNMWLGAAAYNITSNPFAVSNAGLLRAISGSLGGWTLGATSLTSGVTTTTVGIDSGGTNPALYAGSATPTSAPFRVTNAGVLTATSGVIGGTTLGASSLTGGTIQTAASGNRVVIDSSGLNGYDTVLGTTFTLPTNGDAPTFSSGVINKTTYNIDTSSVIRTSTTALDGSANSAGVLINNDGIYASGANRDTTNANIRILSDGSVSLTSDTPQALTINSGGSVLINDGGDVLMRGTTNNPAELRFFTSASPDQYISIYQDSNSTPSNLVNTSPYTSFSNYQIPAFSRTAYGQSFTNTTAAKITSCSFNLIKHGSPTGNITAKLYTHTGTFGYSSTPTGAVLATSDVVSISSLTSSAQITTFTFSGAQQYSMSATTNYIIVVEYLGGDSSNALWVNASDPSHPHNGNVCFYDGTWSAGSNDDLVFSVYNDQTLSTTTGLVFDPSAGAISPYIKFSTEVKLEGTLTVATGTTTVAPIKLVAGTNLATPVAGVIEFDGTNLFITV